MIRKSFFLILLTVLTSSLAAQYRELNQLLQDLNATLQWNPTAGMGFIDLYGGRVIFKLGAPWLLIDYYHLVKTSGVVRKDGAILFPERTVVFIEEYFKGKEERRRLPRVAVILIDPGHGGKDPGAIGFHMVNGKQKKILEKDVVLKVALKLYALLEKEFPDKKILLTRKDDTYLKLEERTKLANDISIEDHEAIIFVSIHANASFNEKARGFEVWYLPPDYRRELINPDSLEEENREIAPILNVLLEEEYTIESITLAREIISGFDREIGNVTENRDIKEESWFVVRKAKMPSVLVELGFITNREEALRLEQEDYLQKLTLGIYTGIRNFIRSFESTKGFTE